MCCKTNIVLQAYIPLQHCGKVFQKKKKRKHQIKSYYYYYIKFQQWGPKLTIVSCNRLAKDFCAREAFRRNYSESLDCSKLSFYVRPVSGHRTVSFSSCARPSRPSRPSRWFGSAIYTSPYYWPMCKNEKKKNIIYTYNMYNMYTKRFIDICTCGGVV